MARAPSAQSTGRLWRQIRDMNYEAPVIERDAGDDGVVHRPGFWTAHDDYESADTEAEGSAEFGPAIRTDGYDRVVALLDHTAGTTQTGIQVVAQVSHSENAPDAEWFDLYEDEAGTGVLVRKIYEIAHSSGDLNASFVFPALGRYMRFKIYTTASNRANSRAVLYVRPIMDAW